MRTILIVMLLLFTLNAKSLFSNEEQVENSKYIGALKDLILSTQKTRGLTNNYLNGNTVALLLVYESRENMKKAIGTMESLPLASDPVISKRATDISQSLIRLNRKALRKKPDYVFNQYTELIEQTLMLAQSVSKRGAKELNPLGRELSKVMMEVMLPLTEYVGQLRGLGSGILAKRKITKTEYVQIQAISNEVKRYTVMMLKQVRKIRSKYGKSCDPTVKIKLTRMESASNKYLILANKEILKKGKISYDTDKFFEQGTELIAMIIDIYDATNKVILKDSKGWL